MICPSCGTSVYRTKTFYLESGEKIEQCKYCPKKHIPKPLAGLFIRAALGINSKGKRTVAHDNDISKRILAEDRKTVIRV